MHARTKDEWRQLVLAGRRALTPELRTAEDRRACRDSSRRESPADPTGVRLRSRRARAGIDWTVSSTPTGRRTVLVPVTGDPGPLNWAEFTGADGLAGASYGLREPTGPVLGARRIRRPGPSSCPRSRWTGAGVRLGRGAGFYDRTLGSPPPTRDWSRWSATRNWCPAARGSPRRTYGLGAHSRIAASSPLGDH